VFFVNLVNTSCPWWLSIPVLRDDNAHNGRPCYGASGEQATNFLSQQISIKKVLAIIKFDGMLISFPLFSSRDIFLVQN
jgi:hypothetical protein